MRKITVTLSGVEDQSQRRDPSRSGAGIALIGLAITFIAASMATKGGGEPGAASAVLAADRTELLFAEPGPQLVHLRNTGDEPLTIEPPSLANKRFRIASDCNAPLQKNESCVVSVAMDPNAGADSKDVMRIASNGGDAAIELIGGASPLAPFEMQPLDFGGQIIGTAGQPRTVHFTNGSQRPVSPGAAETAGPFHVSIDNCKGNSVAPARGCDVFLTFDPTAAGSQSGEVRIPADGKVAAFAKLSGQAVAPLPQLQLAPIGFGEQPFGPISQPGKVRMAELINTTPFPLLLAQSVTDPPFSVARDRCMKAQLQPGDRCDVSLLYTPTAQGEQTGEIRISNTEGVVIARGALSGSGFLQLPPPPTPPQIFIKPQAINFNGDLGTRPITVSNRGNAAVAIQVKSETKLIDYSIDDSACTRAPLAPGGDCQITVTAILLQASAASGLARSRESARIDIIYAGHTDVVTVSAR